MTNGVGRTLKSSVKSLDFMAGGRNKRKKRNSSSGSTETLSPTEKKYKEEFDSQAINESNETSQVGTMEHVAPKLDQILERLSGLEGKLQILENKIENQTQASVELKNEMSAFKDEMKMVKEDVFRRCTEVEEKCKKLEDQILYQEVYQRRENLRFFGLEEEDEEDVEEKVKAFLDEKLDLYECNRIEFQRAHRVGRKRPGSSRPIIVRFLRYPDRERVIRNAGALKGTAFYIKPDLPREIINRRKLQQHRLLQARKEGKRAFFSRSEPDKLFIDGILKPM